MSNPKKYQRSIALALLLALLSAITMGACKGDTSVPGFVDGGAGTNAPTTRKEPRRLGSPLPPYAKVQVSVNGGGIQTGGITVHNSDAIALTAASTVGWSSQKWEIYDYPIGFTVPSGWSTDSAGVYYSNSITPTSFTLPASADTWGKFLIRLRVNDALTNSSAQSKFTDESTALEIVSANGLHDIAAGETNQFDSQRQWVAALKANLRSIDQGVIPSTSTLKINNQRVPWKATARFAITSNVANLASFTVATSEGTAAQGDRVLLTGQTTASQNGLYDVGAVTTGHAALTRSSDMAASADVLPGSRMHVSDGATYTNSLWYLATKGPITLGATALTFLVDSNVINVRRFGAVADSGTTDNGAAFAAAIKAANEQQALLYVPTDPRGGQYWIGAGTKLPRMDTGLGIVGDEGVPAAILFQDTDGDGFVLKYGAKIVRNLNVSNAHSGAFTSLSAVVRLINVTGGNFHNLQIQHSCDNGARLMLEADYNTTNVSGATNASPIVIATSAAHGLSDKAGVTIASVGGNTAANGTWVVTVVDATHFSLNGSTGNGAYTAGGTVVETADAYYLVHLGPWHNHFSTLLLNYYTGGGNHGSGLQLYVNPRSQSVVNPPTQPAGTYSAGIFNNTFEALNIENSHISIDLTVPGNSLTISNNVFRGGSVGGGDTIIKGRGVQLCRFEDLSLRYWDTAAGAALDFTQADNNSNYFAVDFAHSVGQPWPVGPLGTITGATNASPIVITASAGTGLMTGDQTTITTVAGNTAANGTWIVTVSDTTHFSLNGSIGNGAYTSGGKFTSWRNTVGDAATWIPSGPGTTQNGIIARSGLLREDASGTAFRPQSGENDYNAAIHKFRAADGSASGNIDLGSAGSIVLGSDGKVARVGAAEWVLDDGASGNVKLDVGSIWLKGGVIYDRDGAGAVFGLRAGGGADQIGRMDFYHSSSGSHFSHSLDGGHNTTTNATPTTVASTGFTAPNDSAGVVTFTLTGYRTGGAAAGAVGDACAFVRRVRYKKVGAANVQVLATETVGTDYKDDAAVGNPSISTTAPNIVRIDAVGAVGMNITWYGSIHVEAVTL